MGKKKKDVVKTTNQQSSSSFDPSAQFQPQVGAVQNLVNQAATGPFVAGFNQDQLQSHDMVRNAVAGGNPLVNPAIGAVQSGLGFQNQFTPALGQLGLDAAGQGAAALSGLAQTGGGPNPFLSGAIDAQIAQQMDAFAPAAGKMAGTFSQQGGDVGLRGAGNNVGAAAGRFAQDFGRGLGQSTAALLNQSANTQQGIAANAASQLGNLGFGALGTAGAGQRGDVATQLSALSGIPTADALRFSDAERLGGIGNEQQQLAQMQLSAPGMMAAQLGGTISPFALGFGTRTGTMDQTQTTPTFGPSPLAQAAGLGLAGASMFMPGAGAGVGAVTRGLLG
jgi:hypothetical protein